MNKYIRPEKPRFEVTIEVRLLKTLVIEADTLEEALAKAEERYIDTDFADYEAMHHDILVSPANQEAKPLLEEDYQSKRQVVEAAYQKKYSEND